MSKARNMARMGQDTSAGYTGAFDMPAGTTAERPASAGLGWTRLNTDTGSVEVYDGTNWNAVTRPFIASVSGTIYAGAASNLVIAGQNFTSTITVRFLEGGSTVADVTGVSVSAGSATVAVPSAVFNQTVGDSIEIKIVNSDGTISANSVLKTVVGLPTGGTITTSGGYRYHTFTSSSSLVVPTGFSLTAEYLVVAGGGGGGARHAGGGGAGGYLSGNYSLSTGTYSAVVGAGGSGGVPSSALANNGSNSSFDSISTTGGGAGGQYGESAGVRRDNGNPGGSGGGGANNVGTAGVGGSGTAGQGNAGGSVTGGSSDPWAAAGGGGKSAAGGDAPNPSTAGAGGAGAQWLNGVTYAGGGGGGGNNSSGTGGAGGAGGGGAGGGGTGGQTGTAGSANTGGGGGGARDNSGGNGGSGIVIIRYAL